MRTKQEITEYKREWARRYREAHRGKYRRGENPKSRNGFKVGHRKYEGVGAPRGSHNSPATEFRKGDKRIVGKNNWNWKGEKSSYTAKHQWIRRKYGQPQECEICGTTENRMYHWANISGQYKHKKSDWMRLCVPCHKKYDNEKK